LASLINQVTGALQDVIAGHQSLHQLDELPFVRRDVGSQPGAPCAHVLPIRLNAVWVGHKSEILVADIWMQVVPGGTVFIHGDNGSGKTTLIETMLGLCEPISGEITAAAVRYESLDLESLRRRVGYVSQRPMLFQGSIRDNLRYGRPSANDEELHHVLQVVGAADWVADLPDGIDTLIGDTGNRLSGGQAQSLAIARGLVGQPELIVLDEPGNHLAVGVLARILDAIRLAYPQLGIVVVSHGLRGFVPSGLAAEHIAIDDRALVRLDTGTAVGQ
jgi:ABC-type multidrug transport system fused ATPase/permease subunit